MRSISNLFKQRQSCSGRIPTMSTNRSDTGSIRLICIVVCMLLPSTMAMLSEAEPDNAALLYYQAFLLCPSNDDVPQEAAGVFRNESGGDAGAYRKFARDYQHVIQLVEAASNMPYCNWAIPYSQWAKVRPKLVEVVRPLTFLIGANVRVLAADGDYRAALSQSLMLRRLAWHIADDHCEFDQFTLGTVESRALQCIWFVLDVMRPDEKTLRWLTEQLAAGPQLSDVLSVRTKRDFEQLMRAIKEDGKVTSDLREKLAERASDEAQRKEAMALTDDELLRHIRDPYAEFLDSVLEVMGSEISYEAKYARLENLAKEYRRQAETNPAIILPLQMRAAAISELHFCSQTAHAALLNASKAAVEIYLLQATTGRLPETLPDGLPKDPFSGKNFEYRVTEKGFVLRWRVKDIYRGNVNVREHEFTVRR